MKVDVQRHGTVTVIVPQDALTESTLPALQECLAGDGVLSAVRMVLDLSQAPYLDSAGIEFLLSFCGNPPLQTEARRNEVREGPRAAADAGRPVAVRAPGMGGLRPRLAALTETVREALDVTDTLRRFSIFDSVHAAVRSYV